MRKLLFHVEQKNGTIVRQLVGYERYEGQQAYRQLTELYRAVRARCGARRDNRSKKQSPPWRRNGGLRR